MVVIVVAAAEVVVVIVVVPVVLRKESQGRQPYKLNYVLVPHLIIDTIPEVHMDENYHQLLQEAILKSGILNDVEPSWVVADEQQGTLTSD